MKNHFLIFACVLSLLACKDNKQPAAVVVKNTVVAEAPVLLPPDTGTASVDSSIAEQTVTYYVVVADTGLNYYQLRSNMQHINEAAHLAIDTMGRGYNAKKDLVCLPENDEDELYAGEYYPRRFPSVSLSLEYFNFYRPQAGEKTMALVAGIFATKESADSLLQIVKPVSKISFIERSEIYTGCMH